MRTIKPQKLGLLTRCYEHKRRFYLGVSVLAFTPIGAEPKLLSEVALWTFVADQLGKDAALDQGIPKAFGEFLVTGTAYVPDGQARANCFVRASLGEREKTLYVFGDREWRAGRATDPVPFTEMPLDWTRAYGGEGYAKNPLGKGYAAVAVADRQVHALANIEHPAARVTSPRNRPEPAGFGPIDLTWPQRLSKSGSHDDRWLKEDFPGYARDIDWRFFNLASPDQQFDKPLRGDEPFRLENMHPRLPQIEGQLPGFAARCFVNRRADQGEVFEDVTTRLTTVWFFPHAERSVLIFQGAVPVQEDDGADVLQILVAGEQLGKPRSKEYYREILTQRLDKEKGHLFALRDGDLLPDNLAEKGSGDMAQISAAAGQGLLRKNLRRKIERDLEKARQDVAAYGLDPDVHAPPALPPEEPLPELDSLPEFIEQMKARAEQAKKEEEARAAEQEKVVEKLFAELGLNFDEVRAEMKQTPRGPPRFTAAGKLREMRGLAEFCREHDMPAGEIEEILADPEMLQLWDATEAELKKSYRVTAHHQEMAPAMTEERSGRVRDAVANARANGKSFAGIDLTGANLSGMDLSGANFEGAFLESANLEAANLEGVNLKNAVLAHASLKGAGLSRASLTGANLGGADLSDVRAEGDVDLTDAILAKADFSRAAFAGARLQGADCSGAIFDDSDFSRVEATHLILMESDLQGLTLRGARLEKCNFLMVDFSEVDFSGASLKSSVFVGVVAKGARFAGADLTDARFVQACNLEQADFSGANLDQANLRGAMLSESNLSEARLDGADLSGCDLKGAKLYRAVARNARLVKADLRRANMVSINLMNAVLQGANIRSADLRAANLFKTDLARVHADKGTRFTGALTKKARVYPRRSA